MATCLRVLARGTAKVPDYAALGPLTNDYRGVRINRFHGWVPNTTHGMPFVDPDGPKSATSPAPVKGRHLIHVKAISRVIEIPLDDPYIGEYRRHVRDGDFWPADVETAHACGVAWTAEMAAARDEEHCPAAQTAQTEELAALKTKHDAFMPGAAGSK